jgi:hypothetical protein
MEHFLCEITSCHLSDQKVTIPAAYLRLAGAFGSQYQIYYHPSVDRYVRSRRQTLWDVEISNKPRYLRL